MNFKKTLKSIRRLVNDESKALNDVHNYWISPKDGTNLPEEYVTDEKSIRSNFLYERIKNNDSNISILEIGCNAGRNLNYLYNKGFQNLTGIEISANALEKMKESYLNTYNKITLINKPVEDYFSTNEEKQFDLIYTMAVLEHIHKDSEWIFKKMVESTKNNIITIEDESSISWKHFPRNYKKIFEKLGMKQIESEDVSHIEGLHKGFIYRLFEKK